MAVGDGEILPRLAALSAGGIPYWLEYDDGVWDIYVPVEHAAAACQELGTYERENQDWPPPVTHETEEEAEEMSGSAFAGLLAAGLLAWVHYQTGPFDAEVRVFQDGCANSTAILAGEFWRVLTALTLHADLSHMLGNAACSFALGWALCRQLGSGVGLGLAVVSGTIGNLGAAFLTGPGRVTLGASTATFGALGLLSALQFVRNFRRYGQLRSVWDRTWIPLVAALALLALLGVGPRADLVGHFCGFAAGVGLGFPAALLLGRRVPALAQAALLGLTSMALTYAWHLALR